MSIVLDDDLELSQILTNKLHRWFAYTFYFVSFGFLVKWYINLRGLLNTKVLLVEDQ